MKLKRKIRNRIAKKIVVVIEEHPKLYEFLTKGETDGHPQHLVELLTDAIMEVLIETLQSEFTE